MRITALETIRLASRANLLWVRVHTDEGLVGLGETFRGAEAVEAFLHASVAPMLVGRDPLAIDAIAKLLTEPYLGFRSSGVEMRAASAVDIALWDLAGKAAGMPVWQLLGGLTRESIRTYNVPENRIADHRINFKSHNLDQVLEGDLDSLLDALAAADKQTRLQQA
jgi:L-alanine-DL-glutamate epimerase-like enolase superfamily enzyme